MKPTGLIKISTTDEAVVHNNLVSYDGTSGLKIHDSGISKELVSSVLNNYDNIKNHIENDNIHVTTEQKSNWNNVYTDVHAHIINADAHVSTSDREYWNNKENPSDAQAKANQVQTKLNEHVNDLRVHVTTVDKNKWNDTYSKSEIDNKFSGLVTGTDWKESVTNMEELLEKYPSPDAGWTVNTISDNITWRFDGSKWVPISANAIPKSSESQDGLMTTTQVKKLDGIEEKANNYSHPLYEYDDSGNIKYKQLYKYNGTSYTFAELKHAFPDWFIGVTYEAVVPDSMISSHNITKINSTTPLYIYHINDVIKEYWDNKAENILATYNYDGLMSASDKKKLDLIANEATNYIEPEYFEPSKIQQNTNNRFVTDEQIKSWDSKASGTILASSTLNGLMSFTDKVKMDSIKFGANNYIHPTTHPASIIEQDSNNRFVTDEEKVAWNSKAAASLVSTTIDGLMSSSDKVKLNGIEALANHYTHPEFHQPTIIQQNANNRFVTDTQILSWTGKKDANKVLCGTGVFNTTNGTFVAHNIGHTTYSVSITPNVRPTDVGNIWVQKENDYMIVFCDGISTTVTFDWIIIVD